MTPSTAPKLILIAGLPGTGKSTAARAFVQRYGGTHINSDLVRNALNLRGHYGAEDKKKVYQAMLDNTRAALLNKQNVVVDSTFIHESVRTPFESVARNCGADFFWIEMRADERTIRERLKIPRTDSEADFSVYSALRAQSEPLRMPHLVLWSDNLSLENMIHTIDNYTSLTSS